MSTSNHSCHAIIQTDQSFIAIIGQVILNYDNKLVTLISHELICINIQKWDAYKNEMQI